jgi:hypothetical protein
MGGAMLTDRKVFPQFERSPLRLGALTRISETG